MAKLVAVFGATGTQGGSVARALLNDPRNFKVRAVTRNSNSEKAQAIANLGAEVVEGNLDDPSSLPGVLSGCHGVFGVTNFLALLDAEKEVQQGKALVDACKDAGVKHLIFSLSQSPKDEINANVPVAEGKAEIEKYMLASGIPCTSVHYPFYMENMLAGPFKPKEQHDGSNALVIPVEKPIFLISAAEAGTAIAALFRCPDNYYGKVIGLAGDKKTIKQMADILNKHLRPKLFRHSQIPLDQFARMGFPGAEDLAKLLDYLEHGKPDNSKATTRHLDPGTKTFEEWVVAYKNVLEEVFTEE